MLAKFLKDTDGSIAVKAAVGLTAILIATGAAVDYSILVSERDNLQSLADSTALAAAVSIDQNVTPLTQQDLQVFAENYLKDTSNSEANLKLTLNEKGSKPSLLVELSIEQELYLASIFSSDSKRVSTLAEVPIPGAKSKEANSFNIALVMDTTNSMRGLGRMDALKTSATDLLSFLEDNAADETQVSLVPFSGYVRISESNINEPWIHVPTNSDYPNANYSTPTWEGCMNSRRDG